MAKVNIKTEYDAVYFLKILIYLILGSVWISHNDARVLPIGLVAGLVLVQHERLQIDRKIEYAILLIGSVEQN
jgi:CRISPR/Cas system-associated protein Cas7 (RAMP superfamily)